MCTRFGPHNTEDPGIFIHGNRFGFVQRYAAFIGMNRAEIHEPHTKALSSIALQLGP